MTSVRRAIASDLEGLLTLFSVSEVSAAAHPLSRGQKIWGETLGRKGLAVFVSEGGGQIVASCMLITAPNLLRGGRQHGFLENVVTHPQWQGKGHGSAVVRAALDHAWMENCHHVLMQSGRTDPRVHAFYENLGFEPGHRIGYVAIRPEG